MPSQTAQDSGIADESSPRYFGWRVAAACFLMAFATWGFAFYGHAAYLTELQHAHGWSTALISGASTVTYLSAGVLVIFANDVIERFGSHRLVLVGTATLCVSLVVIAFATAPWEIYAAYLLMSFAWLAMGLPAITIILSHWFEQRRGLALSLALNGASFGGVVVAPTLVFLSGAFGFVNAMLVSAAFLAAILVPSALIWIARPAPLAAARKRDPAAPAPVWTRGMALRSAAVWSVSGAFALALLVQVGFMVHQIALLEPLTGRGNAGLAVVLTTAMAIVGRLTLGAFIDRVDPRLASAFAFASQAAALLIMTTTTDTALLLACCALFGFSVGNLITLPPLILQREFDAASFGMLVGLSTSIVTLVAAFGPGLIGLVRDLTGDYSAGLILSVILDAAAAGLVLIRAGRIPLKAPSLPGR